MIKTLFLAIILLNVIQTKADLPPRNFPYTLKSLNNKFQIKSIPYKIFGQVGKTSVYDVKSGSLIYSLDTYFNDATFLTDNGRHIVSVSFWGWQNDDETIGGYAIDFYNEGKKIKSYNIADLVDDKSHLKYTVSHVIWKYSYSIWPSDSLDMTMENGNAYQANDTLYITTVEKKTLVFYIPTGEIVNSFEATSFFRAKLPGWLPIYRGKQGIANGERPSDTIPSFRNVAKDFSTSLKELLGYKEISSAYYCTFMIRIELAIDRKTGRFEVVRLEALERKKDQPDEKGDINFTDNAVLRMKISNWLKDKLLQTQNFPTWVEKWYIFDEFYFTI